MGTIRSRNRRKRKQLGDSPIITNFRGLLILSPQANQMNLFSSQKAATQIMTVQIKISQTKILSGSVAAIQLT